MRTDTLLKTDDVFIKKDIRIPNVSLSSGDVLWMEMENDLQADVFVSFMLGLLDVQRGKALIAGGDISKNSPKAVSYIDVSRWNPKIGSPESFIKLLAHANGLQVSAVMSEFRRMLDGLGGAYALSINFEEMNVGTKRMVSTAASLSMPRLIILLLEPFMGLDADGSAFIEHEIKRIAMDGSSLIILSGSEPPVCSKHKKLGIGL
jgi:ABC-type multidrug transport system ATPase subunit